MFLNGQGVDCKEEIFMKKVLCFFCSMIFVLSVQGTVVLASEVNVRDELYVEELAYMSLENVPETM